MDSHNLLATFYECINWKNWLVDIIRRGLHIDENLYTKIYTTIELEMKTQNILGSKLNNIATKEKLYIIFEKIKQTFLTIFENILVT